MSQVAFGDVDVGNPAELSFSMYDGYPGMVLALNADMWKDLGVIQRLVDNESATGGHVYSSQVHSIIAHEYGHATVFSAILRSLGYAGKGRLLNGAAPEIPFENQKILFEQCIGKMLKGLSDSSAKWRYLSIDGI